MQKMKQLMVRGGVVLGSLGLMAGQAMAAVPEEVTTALGDAKADGASIGGAVLGVIIAIAVFKFLRRAL
ncbi:major capsid protein [Pseudomonas aeruginosa]|uniref:major capsid protein n=1 Tax=Pseudomonas aeruginosa TaxID=287 RepID=UPI00053DFF34|nr:major capsid protein [Pseudomonas aeruginosa]MBM9947291.1 phage coat protein [Pseudomonas aeruginosa]MBX9505113.1 phage coat protein [Pseudomonas aeruginosa]HDY6335483.1 phage coat protein [Pseudomonas aeruginosa]